MDMAMEVIMEAIWDTDMVTAMAIMDTTARGLLMLSLAIMDMPMEVIMEAIWDTDMVTAMAIMDTTARGLLMLSLAIMDMPMEVIMEAIWDTDMVTDMVTAMDIMDKKRQSLCDTVLEFSTNIK